VNYAGLQTYITAFLELDAGTVAQLPTQIALAEAELDRLLDMPDSETTAYTSTVADSAVVALPSDFTRVVSAQISDGTTTTYLKPEALDALRARFSDDVTTGTPLSYAIADGEMQLFPIANDVYTITIIYIAGIPALSATNTSNWLLAAHPDAYLYATLLQTQPYLADDKRAGLAAVRLAQIVSQINEQGKRYKTPEPGQLRNRDFVMMNRRRAFSITNG
jgi:hypothetical protein